MSLKVLTLGAALALAASAAVAAGEPAERIEERIVVMGGDGPRGMDADKDGAVTREEFRALHDRMFARLDKDGDGRLAGDEFRHRSKGPGGEEIEIETGGPGGGHHGGPAHHGGGERDVRIVRHGPGNLDANKDGKVSFEEFAGPMREHFQEMDRNRSGFLEEDELKGERRMMFRHERRD